MKKPFRSANRGMPGEDIRSRLKPGRAYHIFYTGGVPALTIPAHILADDELEGWLPGAYVKFELHQLDEGDFLWVVLSNEPTPHQIQAFGASSLIIKPPAYMLQQLAWSGADTLKCKLNYCNGIIFYLVDEDPSRVLRIPLRVDRDVLCSLLAVHFKKELQGRVPYAIQVLGENASYKPLPKRMDLLLHFNEAVYSTPLVEEEKEEPTK